MTEKLLFSILIGTAIGTCVAMVYIAGLAAFIGSSGMNYAGWGIALQFGGAFIGAVWHSVRGEA